MRGRAPEGPSPVSAQACPATPALHAVDGLLVVTRRDAVLRQSPWTPQGRPTPLDTELKGDAGAWSHQGGGTRAWRIGPSWVIPLCDVKESRAVPRLLRQPTAQYVAEAYQPWEELPGLRGVDKSALMSSPSPSRCSTQLDRDLAGLTPRRHFPSQSRDRSRRGGVSGLNWSGGKGPPCWCAHPLIRGVVECSQASGMRFGPPVNTALRSCRRRLPQHVEGARPFGPARGHGLSRSSLHGIGVPLGRGPTRVGVVGVRSRWATRLAWSMSMLTAHMPLLLNSEHRAAG